MTKIKFILLFLLVIALGFSCQDDVFDNLDTVTITDSNELNSEQRTVKKIFENKVHTISLPILGSALVNGSASIDSTQINREMPKLNNNNIVLNWKKMRKWEEDKITYIEVPMNTGGKLFVTRTWKDKNASAQHEHTYAHCMLVIKQENYTKKIEYFVTTLIGTKDYLKQNGKRIKNLHHKPNDNAFTGLVYYSYLSGRIKEAYYYTDGKMTHKIFKKKLDKKSDSNSLYFQIVNLISPKSGAKGYTRSESEEFYCDYCKGMHSFDYPGCEGETQIVNCKTCYNRIENCVCCYYCFQYPCICLEQVCSYCGNDPCTCFSCPFCETDPCICDICEDCGNAPCTCGRCPECGRVNCICCTVCIKYPCICNTENECNGPKCSECGKYIASDPLVRSTTTCEICRCTDELCEEIERFVNNPDLYSMLTRTNILPDPKPGPDYVYIGGKWVYFYSIAGYNGFAYQTSVWKSKLSHLDFIELLIKRRDAFKSPAPGGIPSTAVALGTTGILDKFIKLMKSPTLKYTIKCSTVLFAAKTDLVTECYQNALDLYNKNSLSNGGYIIETAATDGGGDLPTTHTFVQIFTDKGLPLTSFTF